jgi:hypothetical protein
VLSVLPEPPDVAEPPDFEEPPGVVVVPGVVALELEFVLATTEGVEE